MSSRQLAALSILSLASCGTRTGLIVDFDGTVAIDAARTDLGMRDATIDVVVAPDLGRPAVASRGDVYNVWGLAIDSPAQQYYLNAGTEAPESFVLDDTHVLRIAAGATVTLTGDSVNSAEHPNRDAAGVPGVPPDPLAIDGEFVQVDVLSIVPAP